MTIDMSGRRLLGVFAVIVPVALIVLGILAWRAGGEQQVGTVVMPVAVPGSSQ